jgi:NAD+ kinase
VVEVTIRESKDRRVTLLFDPEHNLEDRILSEQFVFEDNGRPAVPTA